MAKFIDRTLTTLASCWLVQLANGECQAFTDFDQDLMIDNIIYKANSASHMSAINKNTVINKDNMQIFAMLDNDIISKEKILNGYYDNAFIEIFMVDYNNPNESKINLKAGKIGKIKLDNQEFIAEICELADNTKWQVNKYFSKDCRANLGDNYCGINLTKFEVKSKIKKIISPSSFMALNTQNYANGYFNNGFVIIDNKKYLIQNFITNIIHIKVTDELKISNDLPIILIPGCDKSAKKNLLM